VIRSRANDVMTEKENLLPRARFLKPEDWEAIAAALGTGPSGLLRHQYGYYRDAALDWGLLGFHDREVVIARLRKLPFWPQARDTLRKLEMPLEELEQSSNIDTV